MQPNNQNINYNEDNEDPESQILPSLTQNSQNAPKLWKNKQRTLLAFSRGVTFLHRHLIKDLYSLLPHSKKEFKLEKKNIPEQLQELSEMRNCSSVLYFESRKSKFLYLSLAQFPNGPTAKFQITNIDTCQQLKLSGNCMKGSRPFLSFDKSFEQESFLGLIKEMLIQAFNTPRYHPKSKPFYDHVFSFSFFNNQIYFRNYEIINEDKLKKKKIQDKLENLSLVEIGPRFCMNPIKIFDSYLSGETLWSNPFYVTPTKARQIKVSEYLKKHQKRKLKSQNIIQTGKEEEPTQNI